jgi:hypothetical protein
VPGTEVATFMTEERASGDEARGREGRYANSFEVGHNAFEFVLVFGQVDPETGVARAHTRVITAPAYARAFAQTLLASLDGYQRTFGPIPTADDGTASS